MTSDPAIAPSPSTSTSPLSTALLEVHQILQTFAQSGGFEVDRLAPAFGTTVDSAHLHTLGEQFAQGDFRGLPAIAVRPSQDLNGAMGVYISETNQIYLSDSFLLHGTQDQIVAVVLEEIGHGLDAQLNLADSAGDEGAIFSALVRGQNLSEARLAALHAENDQATLLLDGQWVTVEQASLTVNIAAQNVVDGDTTDIASLLADPGADGLISLREAIAAANNTAGADTITFDEAGTIAFSSGSTHLAITDELTIDGNLNDDDSPDITVDAQGNSRVFNIEGSVNVTIDGLTITGGDVNGHGGGIHHISSGTVTINNSTVTGNAATGGLGGGVFSDLGAVTLTNSTISDNSAGLGGGIFSNLEAVTLTNSTVSGNMSAGLGGGIVTASGAVTLDNSTVSSNSSAGQGGGVFTLSGAITLGDSTVSGNASNTRGGGIFTLSGTTTLTNSTVSGNTSTGLGAGLYASSGAITLTNSTVSDNVATNRGGGVYSFGGDVMLSDSIISNSTITDNTAIVEGGGISKWGGSGTIDIANSIIAENVAGAGNDLFGTFGTLQNNLIGDITGATINTNVNNLVGVDPRLDPLADNGGLTQTHVPYSDSPVLNSGSDALATAASLTTDQRGTGFDRFVGVVDIGAAERQDSVVSILASDTTVDENTPGDTITYRISRTYEIVDDLTVELGLTLGTDLSLSDFTLSGGNVAVNAATNTATLTIPAREFSVDITLTPNDDTTPEADESLTLTLVDTNNYTIDSSNSAATATIIANDPVVPTPTPTTPTPTPTTPTPIPTPTPTTPTPTPTPTPIDDTAPMGTIAALPIPIRDTPVDQVQITFDEAVINFDLSDLQLTRNGTVTELTGVTLTTSDNVNWSLEGLSLLTIEDGTYEITLTDNTDITDTSGNLLVTETTITWQTGQTGTRRPDIDFGGGIEGKTSRGSNQSERILGTPFNDVLRGGDGNDRILGGFGQQLFGRDRLFGGDGNDVLKAGAGKDFLNGGTGRDRLFGGKNDDELLGGQGNDILHGGKGDDVLNGGLGRDQIKSGRGRDTIVYRTLSEGTDTVIDFNVQQDLIDLSAIFSASEYAADNTFAQYVNYIQLQQVGSATHVAVDTDGSGSGNDFTTLAKLDDIQSDTLTARNFVL